MVQKQCSRDVRGEYEKATIPSEAKEMLLFRRDFLQSG